MKYWLYDFLISGDEFERELDARTMAEAVEIAAAEWNGLSEHDKERRSDFFVGKIDEWDIGYCDRMDIPYIERMYRTVDIMAGEGVEK